MLARDRRRARETRVDIGIDIQNTFRYRSPCRPRTSEGGETHMSEFEIIFSEPLAAAGYVCGSALCLLILLAWGALCLWRRPAANGPVITPSTRPQRRAPKLVVVR